MNDDSPFSESFPAGVESTRVPSSPRPLLFDESRVVSTYANVIQVTGTAEEVVLDIGFDWPAVEGRIGDSGKAARTYTQQLVLGFVTAKRLWKALELAVKRHESVFGEVHVAVGRRLADRSP